MSRVKGRSVHDTNKMILDAARKRFGQFGFSGTSIDEIAFEAKLTRRTFYDYYKGKNEVLEHLLAEESRIYIDILQEIDLNDRPESILEQVFSIIFDLTMDRVRYVSPEPEINPAINIPDEAKASALYCLNILDVAIRRGIEEGIFGVSTSSREFMSLIIIFIGGFFVRSETIDQLIGLDAHSKIAIDGWKKLLWSVLLNSVVARTE